MKLIVDRAEVLASIRTVVGDILVVMPGGIELPAESVMEPLNPF